MEKVVKKSVKSRIVSAAWQLFYEKGYNGTTVDDIIELSETSKGSFYYYFSTKDELLNTLSLILDEFYEELEQKMDKEMNSFDKLMYLNYEAHSMMEEKIKVDLLSSLYSTQLVAAGQRHLLDQNRNYYKLVTKVVTEGQKRGEIRDDISVLDITRYYSMCERADVYKRQTISYHLEQFEMMCEWLHKSTDRCILSFVDAYKESPFLEMEQEDMLELGEGLGKIAKKYKLPLYTCSERIDLTPYGIRHGACIDKDKIYELIGYKLDVKKDAGQRKECGCVESIDIGVYDTCTHGCRYCYAVNSQESAKKKRQRHNPESPLLVGQLQGDEIITDKEVTTSRDNQISLFDLPEMYMDF